MTLLRNLTGTTPVSDDAPNVEKVFSTYLYEGTGNTSYNSGDGVSQSIVNGIDLAGEGGMVWVKDRNAGGRHSMVDTERGATEMLSVSETGAEATTTDSTLSFNSDGFTLGIDNGYQRTNFKGTVPYDYASWTFRKAPRFFDVVTYTGNGTAGREIAHDLGVAPGMMVVKKTSGTGSWMVYHRSLGNTLRLKLDSTDATQTSSGYWNNTSPTDTVFTLGTNSWGNGSGNSYVAYLFAHDPDGEDDDGMIACGSYTGNGSVGHEINLGWEPQYLLYKNADGTDNWEIVDVMRGMPNASSGSVMSILRANSSNAEFTNNPIFPTPTGFTINNTGGGNNGNGNTYIYMAIRAPMMVEPEAGSEVFAIADSMSGSTQPAFNSPFPVDMGFQKRPAYSQTISIGARLTGTKHLYTDTTAAEVNESEYVWDFNDGWGGWTVTNSDYMSWMFKRAKGFFDVVAHNGDGITSRPSISHNLQAVPELILWKMRNSGSSWYVYHKDVVDPSSGGGNLKLNNDAAIHGFIFIDDLTDSSFTLEAGGLGARNYNHISYLFATLDGVSKVGSYTGNGSNQNIACGFSGGARFVMIKRTDSTGDWYIWDTARGIVTGNDPHLSLNTTAAEVTSDDSIDPVSSGFTVNQVSATNINVTSATYIFLAIA